MSSSAASEPKKLVLNEELVERIGKNLKYKKYVSALIYGSTISWFAAFILIYIIAKSYDTIVPYWVVIPLLGFLFVFAVWNSLLGRKKKSYPVKDDEWALFYSDLIAKNLKKCLGTEHKAMKSQYQKTALKYAQDFLTCIKENWRIGSFKLVRQFVGTTVADFKNNLQYVLIPAIRKGERDKLERVEFIMTAIKMISADLQIEGLKTINNVVDGLISKGILQREKPTKLGYNDINILGSRAFKNPIFIVCWIILASAIFGGLLFYFGLSKEFAIGSSITVFGILITTYGVDRRKK